MIEETTKNSMQFDGGGMNLKATLFCGQSFSWQRTEDGFAGTAGNHCVVARQNGSTICLSHPGGAPFTDKEERFWHTYFAMDLDYPALQQRFCANKNLRACVMAEPGIRVLRQPFFETLLAFIISQNNHIPRIAAIVQRLKTGFGAPLGGGQFAFPLPEALAPLEPEDLAELQAGYRAKYLIDAAQKVALGQVNEGELRAMLPEDARKKLCTILGVGSKVADCVLLFGLGQWQTAPMDVWMKRAMTHLFPGGMPKETEGFEGIAQQYIFHWARQNLA